jgi:hypothetical protein
MRYSTTRTLTTAFLLTSILASAAVAQDARSMDHSVFQDYLNPSTGSGFLRVPGLDFRSSVGFSYYSANQSGSAGMGYYMGHFNYSLSKSLTLRWDVGIRSWMTGPDGMSNPEFFIPNFDLTYAPNKNFMLRLQFQQGLYFNNPYGRPYRR